MSNKKLITPYPGRFLRRRVMPALELDDAALANRLGVPLSTVQSVISGQAPITAGFAGRLEAANIGRKKHWLDMQRNFDKANRLARDGASSVNALDIILEDFNCQPPRGTAKRLRNNQSRVTDDAYLASLTGTSRGYWQRLADLGRASRVY